MIPQSARDFVRGVPVVCRSVAANRYVRIGSLFGLWFGGGFGLVMAGAAASSFQPGAPLRISNWALSGTGIGILAGFPAAMLCAAGVNAAIKAGRERRIAGQLH